MKLHKLPTEVFEVLWSGRQIEFRPKGLSRITMTGCPVHHLYEEALNRMQERVSPEAMRPRRSTVEHPFAKMKYRIFGHPRQLMRGLSGAKVKIGLATMPHSLKRITNVLGPVKLTETLHHARLNLAPKCTT
jgi:hypothetical protein